MRSSLVFLDFSDKVTVQIRCGGKMSVHLWLFVASLWPPCVADSDIIFCPVVSFLLLLFPRLLSAVAEWMSTILPHMVWLSANLECRSEMCYTRLAGNTGRNNDAKNRHLQTIAQHFVRLYLRNQGTHRQSEKAFKQQYLFHMSPQHGQLRPTSG